MPASLSVLYEDNHLLVVNKPAGLATMGTQAGQASVVTCAAEYLKRKYHKPGNVFVGVVSRLDSLVSGVLILARTSKAAARLSEQIREHGAQKSYLAWVEGRVAASPPRELVDWMIKDESRHRMVIAQAERPGAQLASLSVQSLEVRGSQTLVAIELLTGRKHQIRLQLSSRGHPVLGDRKYDATTRFPHGIALHSRRLVIEHPTRAETLTFQAPPPAYWPK